MPQDPTSNDPERPGRRRMGGGRVVTPLPKPRGTRGGGAGASVRREKVGVGVRLGRMRPVQWRGMPGPAVELIHVRKTYREGESERVVLDDVSVTIEPGQIAVLVGRSGSGKSTLLNLMDGIDLTALDEDARTRFRRRRIGFVFQFFNLIPLLTIEENLLLPLELNGVTAAAGLARARGLLERVGLGGRGGSLPDRLSGGEQQRVAIARALVHDPALILADEPTGTLDAETATAVLALLDGLAREAGKTVVMVTHSREVVGVADRIFSVQRGGLVAQSTGAGPSERGGG
jgi:putative ABC transport system ATP-binding protein